jgi:outer membrane receptor protein involved in Fe transport
MVAASASSVYAQDTETASDEVIVVRGQKIERTLLETQASVAVVTARDIVEKDLQSFREAFRITANVIDADFVDAGFVIRGVNSEGLTPGGSPLATFYVDGAPQTVQGTRRGARGLFDVQQVEVYRGPQATLTGRASLAGAIYVTTQDPTYEWDYASRFTVGENETAEAGIAFGGPIIDDVLAVRVAGEVQRSESNLNFDGYEQYDAFDEFVEDEYYQIRSKLLFEPKFLNGGRALLTYSFAHDSPTYDDIAGPGLGFEYDERRGDLNAGTPFFQENRSADNHTGVLDVTYPLSETLSLTSLSTYNFTDLDRPSINAGTPGEVFVAEGTEEQSFATQEFRLNSYTDTLDWVLGVFLTDEQFETDRTLSNFFSGGRTDISRPESQLRSAAVFGEADWRFAEGWTLTAGGRLHYEEQENDLFFARDFTDPAQDDVLTDPDVFEAENSVFLPKAAISYEVAPNQTVGLLVSTGFRSGGAGIDGTDGSIYEFDEEYATNTELSYRGRFADGRLNVAANLFYMDWTDQQVEVQTDPLDFASRRTENAAESHSYGFELEAQAQVTRDFTAFAAVGHVQTEFDSFDEGSVIDFSGLPFPESPEWTVAFGGDYEHPSGFFLGADARYVDAYFARDFQNAPIDTVGDYTTANLRAGYRAERWSLTVFSDNAFDEEYFTYRDVIGDFDCCATLGPRRLTGVTLRFDR